MRPPGRARALNDRIIGLVIKVHRKLGPGLLEAVYHHGLCQELQLTNLEFQSEISFAGGDLIRGSLKLRRRYE